VHDAGASWSEAPHHPHIAERRTVITANGATQVAPVPRFSGTPAGLPDPMSEPLGVDDVLAGWADGANTSAATAGDT
jgi:alpha-methylacyl-CoA racemase